ncbi:hypothetical protein SETIT_9G538100v2 [Setaria italica]|uniref:Uncharacterized protein n=1 Tax=Setaria italica TaxID=4555 RepID=A0A368SVQ7_SETIT|nr:hypothetical protein SETIT_9G538100v2 [Setaria italica]
MEEAQAVAPETGTTQPTWARAQWASIKSKARDARECAVTRTRQAFSMFREAKVESADKAGASKDESSSPQ